MSKKQFSARELLARRSSYLKIALLQRKTQKALHASKLQHQLLFEHSADGIVVADAEGRYIEANLAACNILGYSREELLLRTIQDVLEPDEWSRISPEVARCADGQVIRGEWRFRRKDGTGFVGEMTGSQLPDGRLHGILRDITVRVAKEAAIINNEKQVRSILESMTDGYFVLGHDWRIRYLNSAGERFLNRLSGDLVGKLIWEEFPGTVGSQFEQVYRRVAASQIRESFAAYYPDTDRWYEVTANPAAEGLTVFFRDITGSRHIEQEREHFAAMVDASPDFIGVAGLDHKGLYVNRAGRELVGLDPDQVASITVRDFFPENEHARIFKLIGDTEGGEPLVVDTYFQHLRTGQLIPVSWSYLRLRDASGNVTGYATVTRDLTEKKNTENLLQISEERRRLALDTAELGTWHVEPATRTTQTDARYRAIFGTTEEWTDYLQAYAAIHPDDLPAVKEAVEAATRSEDPVPYAIEYRIVHPDGSLHWVCAKGRATIEGTGATKRVVSFDGTVADITDQKQGEQERERLVARLREEDLRKDEFLATLAHELRNPLAALSYGLQVIRTAPGNADVVGRVRSVMERQLGQIVHLIEDLLDVSRMSRGMITLRKERIDLVKAVEQAIEACQPSVTKASHELLIDFPPAPIYLDADLTRITQVFSNLLSNAAKFTNRGGKIQLAIQENGTEAVISVRDNGIGISPEMLPHIFDVFTQGEDIEGRVKEGLGIGLSVVKRLVEMHNGSVEVRSDGHNSGSEFIVRLPQALVFSGQEAANPPSVAYVTKRHRILVVDDNLSTEESLSLMLTVMGNETSAAHDGVEALEVAEAFRPGVIFLDIGMPRLNGYEVCRRIRQQEWGKGITIIAVTGRGREEDKRQSLEAGIDYHLVKPVDPAVLQKLLADVGAARA